MELVPLLKAGGVNGVDIVVKMGFELGIKSGYKGCCAVWGSGDRVGCKWRQNGWCAVGLNGN